MSMVWTTIEDETLREALRLNPTVGAASIEHRFPTRSRSTLAKRLRALRGCSIHDLREPRKLSKRTEAAYAARASAIPPPTARLLQGSDRMGGGDGAQPGGAGHAAHRGAADPEPARGEGEVVMAFRVYGYRWTASGRRYWKVEDRSTRHVLRGPQGGASIFYDRSEAARARDKLNGAPSQAADPNLFEGEDV